MAMNRQAHDALIKKLATISDEKQLKDAILREAKELVGTEDEERLSQRAGQLQAEVNAYNTMHIDNVAADYAQQRIKTTTIFDKNGFSGQSTQVQAKLGAIDSTSFFGHATVNQDKTGNPSSVNVGVNVVGTPTRVGGWHVLPVGRLESSIPTNGDQFSARNITGVAGAIFAPHNSKLNITAAAVTDGKLTDPSIYLRASGTAYENNVTVTPYAETLVGLKSGDVSAGLGVRVDKDLGGGYGVYGQGAVNASGLTKGNVNLSGQATIGFMWGGTSKKSEIEERLSQHASTLARVSDAHPAFKADNTTVKTSPLNALSAKAQPQPSAADVKQLAEQELNQGHFSAGIDKAYQAYKMLESDPKAQQTFVKHMAENLSKHSPMFSNAADARQYLEGTFDRLEHIQTASSNQAPSHG